MGMVGAVEKTMRLGLGGLAWAQQLFDNSVGGGVLFGGNDKFLHGQIILAMA